MCDIFFSWRANVKKSLTGQCGKENEIRKEGHKLKVNELNYFIEFQNRIKYTWKYYVHCRTYFTCFGPEKSTMLKHLRGNVSAKLLNCVLVLQETSLPSVGFILI